MIKQILYIIISLSATSAFAQTELAGVYNARSMEATREGDSYQPVHHVLELNEDSTFTYKKEGRDDSACNNVYAGFWSKSNNTCVLNFIGEPALPLNIKSFSGTLLLDGATKEITFAKEITQPLVSYMPEAGAGVKKKKKKHKEPGCFTF